MAENPDSSADVLGRVDYFSSAGAACLGIALLLGGLVSLRNKPLVLDLSRRKR